jgi:hypothetical protein
MILKSLFSLLFACFLIAGCSSNPLDVDTSHVNVQITFHNAYSELNTSSSASLLDVHRRYKADIPDLYDYFLGSCIGFRQDPDDTTFLATMQRFQADSVMGLFQEEISRNFTDCEKIQHNLIDGFKHLKYHLPDGKQPEDIVFMNSTLKSSVFCTEREIGIGLERYLGPQNSLIRQLDGRFWYRWVKEGMKREYLERDVLSGWIETHIVEEPKGNLAEKIVQWGKILYLTKAAFPDMEDHLILRYSFEGWEWALKNERMFWEYLVSQKFLFDTNDLNVMNMINPGPTTSGLPEKGAPDRMGQFIGYRMVKNYVEESQLDLNVLVEVPYNDILQSYEIEE